jgi:hypothetical protein
VNRRTFITGLGATLLLPRSSETAPLELSDGPHLLLDDWLVAHTEGLRRVVHPPKRVPEPVLDSRRFGVTQPYLAVVREPETGRYRIWYNHGPAAWHAESADGIAWEKPRVAWDLRRGYGASLIDDRGRDPDPQRRFKFASWQSDGTNDDTPRDNGGMFVGFSADGLDWTPWTGNPVLRTYPTGWPLIEPHGIGDTVDVFYDPIRRRYGAAVKVHALPEDHYAPAPKAGKIFRRLVGMSTSPDFVHWEKPWRIHVPDPRDEGLLEFYGMGGIHARGPLLIGQVRVLRDDLPCDPGGPKDGIGYTALAWSRDGRTWTRDREPFLDRNREPGTWDHAMAWGSGALPVGDELFLYYGGYARGHKIAADKERQIGLARMPRDRYVSRSAGRDEGLFVTKSLTLPGRALTLNLVARGEVTVRLLDEAGHPLPGFGASHPITGDHLAGTVPWSKDPRTLAGHPVRIEVRLRDADLFSLNWV